MDISMVKFDEKGLVPAVVQEGKRPGAHAGLYEQGVAGKNAGDWLYVVFQPQPSETLAERRDFWKCAEGAGSFL